MTHDVVPGLPRDVYLAAMARAVSILGNVVAVTALLLHLHDRGAGAWAVAGMLAAGALPIVVFAPLVGMMVDRYDSRLLIVASSLWQSVLCALLAFVGHPQVVLPLVALNAFGTALTNPVFLALARQMVSRRQLAAANSLLQGGVTIATTGGPAFSGLLTGLTGGARVPLLLDAVIFLGIAATGLLIGTRRRPERKETKMRARDGIMLLFTDRPLAAAVLLAVLLPVVVHLIYVAQVFLVRDTFGASALAFGLLQATHMVGVLTGTALASRLNTARRILLISPIAAAVMSTAIGLIGVISMLPATFALYVVAGIGMGIVSAAVGTLLLLRTPEAKLGRAFASFTAVHRTAGLVAYGIGGLVVGLLAPEVVYELAGAGALLIVLVLAPAFRRAWSVS